MIIDLTEDDDEILQPTKRMKPSDTTGTTGTGKVLWEPFYLMRSDYPLDDSNTKSISLRDVITFDESIDNPIEWVFFFNYMIDFSWLLQELPVLTQVPCCCLHGSTETQSQFQRIASRLPLMTAAVVNISIPFGTHHSKMGFIFYKTGVRMFISTANLIEVDNTMKTQGIYVQDFPLKGDLSASSDFGSDLLEYLREVHVDGRCSTHAKATAQLEQLQRRLQLYDYSSAEVMLVASVPGHHAGAARSKWGHMRMRKVMQETTLPDGFDASCPLVMQVSSIGSMGKDEKVLKELSESFAGSHSAPLQLVWPTRRSVLQSTQGINAGGSICCDRKTLYDTTGEVAKLKRGFAEILHAWDGSSSGRALSTPHMKCFFRYKQCTDGCTELGWILLTSCNLSQAAWGVLRGDKLFIKSYEIGVLFLPSRVKTTGRKFSCTPSHHILGESQVDATSPRRFIITGTDVAQNDTAVMFPLPFRVPPLKYEATVDIPWVWN